MNAAAATGAIIAPPLIVLLYQLWGWRTAFLLTGALGFVWDVLLAALVLGSRAASASHPRRAGHACARGGRGRSAQAEGCVGGELFRFPQTWGLFLARVVADPLWWFYLFWLPKYLREDRGFTLEEMGLVAWMPYLTADLGGIAGGWLSGKVDRSRQVHGDGPQVAAAAQRPDHADRTAH